MYEEEEALTDLARPRVARILFFGHAPVLDNFGVSHPDTSVELARISVYPMSMDGTRKISCVVHYPDRGFLPAEALQGHVDEFTYIKSTFWRPPLADKLPR